jgi:hypothetical protein
MIGYMKRQERGSKGHGRMIFLAGEEASQQDQWRIRHMKSEQANRRDGLTVYCQNWVGDRDMVDWKVNWVGLFLCIQVVWLKLSHENQRSRILQWVECSTVES